jgi:hypothetical protein
MSSIFRVPNSKKMNASWGPKLGDDALRHFRRFVWFSYLMGPATVALFLAIWLSVRWKTTNSWILPWVVGVIAWSVAVTMVISFILARRVASKTLGVRITSKNNPPREDSAYRSWCLRNNLEPYAANQT